MTALQRETRILAFAGWLQAVSRGMDDLRALQLAMFCVDWEIDKEMFEAQLEPEGRWS